MTSQHDSNSSGPERTLTLNIRTEEEKREMMREMLVEFVRVVDPREDGLLDTLYASYMLTETDNESLSGKDVLNRKDQARKLWVILNEVQLEDFMSSVAPELCKMYPHIIPSRFVAHAGSNVTPEPTGDDCQKTRCLRHAIQGRIRATSMADMLYSRNFLDFENYGDIISGNYEADPVWESIFSTFCERTESEVQTLMDGLRGLLHHYYMKIPADDNLKEIVTAGLPCTCESPVSSLPVSASVPQRKVGSWLRRTRFSLTRSSATSKTYMPASNYSSIATRKSASSHASSCPEAGNVCEATAAPDDTVIMITEDPRVEENGEFELDTIVNIAKNIVCHKKNRLMFFFLFFCVGLWILSILLYMISNEWYKTETRMALTNMAKGHNGLLLISKDLLEYVNNVSNMQDLTYRAVKDISGKHNALAKYVYSTKHENEYVRLLWA